MDHRENNPVKIYGMRASEEKTLQMKKPSSSVLFPTPARGVTAEERARLSAAATAVELHRCEEAHEIHSSIYSHHVFIRYPKMLNHFS